MKYTCFDTICSLAAARSKAREPHLLFFAAGLVLLTACGPTDDQRTAMYDAGYKAVQEKISTSACLLRAGEAGAEMRALVDRAYPADVAAKDPGGYVAYARNLHEVTSVTLANASQENTCSEHQSAMSNRPLGEARRLMESGGAYQEWLVYLVIRDMAEAAGCNITSNATDQIKDRIKALPASGAGVPNEKLSSWVVTQAVELCPAG